MCHLLGSADALPLHIKIKKNLINVTFIWCFLFLFPQTCFANHLYPNEAMQHIGGYPCLSQFTLASPKKPLVVLIPGDANLARIFYGAPHSNPKDFLAYWLHRQGYSTLAISYPTDNVAFDHQAYPLYRIHDWAKQAVLLTQQTIEQHHLNSNVLLVVWSMGGIITVNYQQLAQLHGLHVVAMSLSATAPIPNLIANQDSTIRFTEQGLAARVALRQVRFLQFLDEENAINHHVIIPKNVYVSDFLGNTPVALLNTAYTPDHGLIKTNPLLAQQDSLGLSFKDYPLTGMIHGDSESDLQHVISDSYTWMFLNQQTIFHQYFSEKNTFALARLHNGQLVKKLHRLEANLSCTVPGGHFFFVGQVGAHKTAQCIAAIYPHLQQLEDSLHDPHLYS